MTATVRAPKPHEAEEWIRRELLVRIAHVPCSDQDERLYNHVRREVTVCYYATKPKGEVMIQLIIDAFINEAKVRRENAIRMLA